jgi:hypothetical protein
MIFAGAFQGKPLKAGCASNAVEGPPWRRGGTRVQALRPGGLSAPANQVMSSQD